MLKKMSKNVVKLILLSASVLFFSGCNSMPGDEQPMAKKTEDVKPAEEKKENLVWDAGAVQLEYHKLAPGVYAYYPTDAKDKNPKGYPVATSGGFVVGENGVLVVESMVNKRLADQVMGFVKKVTNKPILYVVNTSYHGDHAYGNYVFPKVPKSSNTVRQKLSWTTRQASQRIKTLWSSTSAPTAALKRSWRERRILF